MRSTVDDIEKQHTALCVHVEWKLACQRELMVASMQTKLCGAGCRTRFVWLFEPGMERSIMLTVLESQTGLKILFWFVGDEAKVGVDLLGVSSPTPLCGQHESGQQWHSTRVLVVSNFAVTPKFGPSLGAERQSGERERGLIITYWTKEFCTDHELFCMSFMRGSCQNENYCNYCQ